MKAFSHTAPASEQAECLLMGNSELIPYFALFFHAACALPIQMYLSQPMNCITFILLILFPILPGGGRGNE